MTATGKSLSERDVAGRLDGSLARRSLPPVSAGPWETGAGNGA
jgi:hypothetical protein